MTAERVGSPRPPTRPWVVVRWVVRGMLVLALVGLVTLVVLRQTASTPLAAPGTTAATTSATPSTSPSPTPSPTITAAPSAAAAPDPVEGEAGVGGTGGGQPEPPAAPAPVVTSFTGTSSVGCPVPSEAPAPGTSQAEPPTVSLSWTGTGADSAFFGIQTRDAQAEPYSSVGVNDSIAVDFPCPSAGQIYTITLVGPGGAASETVEVPNTGYTE